MVLKGLAVAGAIATLAIVVFAVLLLRPAAPSTSIVAEPVQAGSMLALPNGLAAPQLQPDAAPVLVTTIGQKSLAGVDRGNAVSDSFKLSDVKSASASAAQEKALYGCGGE